MRRLVYVIGLTFAFNSFSASLINIRGFKNNKCYKHLGIRVCSQDKDYSCHLEVFPQTKARVVFYLDQRKDFLIPGKSTKDYGMFHFKVTKSSNSKTFASIVGIERFPLGEWDQYHHKTKGTASEFACPK